jgi:hypothetical protein
MRTRAYRRAWLTFWVAWPTCLLVTFAAVTRALAGEDWWLWLFVVVDVICAAALIASIIVMRRVWEAPPWEREEN